MHTITGLLLGNQYPPSRDRLHYSFFFSIVTSFQWNIFIFIFCIFFRFKIILEIQNSGSGSLIAITQSTNSCVTSLPLSFYKIVRHLPFIKHKFFDKGTSFVSHLISTVPDPFKTYHHSMFPLQQHLPSQLVPACLASSVHR